MNNIENFESHIPEHIAVGNHWVPNLEEIDMIGAPLFLTVEGVKVFHGDGYWAFPENQHQSGNFVIANEKFDYNDGKERYKYRRTIQDAISTFNWLNS